jgi:hypothetical protein
MLTDSPKGLKPRLGSSWRTLTQRSSFAPSLLASPVSGPSTLQLSSGSGGFTYQGGEHSALYYRYYLALKMYRSTASSHPRPHSPPTPPPPRESVCVGLTCRGIYFLPANFYIQYSCVGLTLRVLSCSVFILYLYKGLVIHSLPVSHFLLMGPGLNVAASARLSPLPFSPAYGS